MLSSKVTETRLPDLNNEEGARTLFTFEGAVRADVEVFRDVSGGLRQKGQYVAKAAWGSRRGLTLDEAEEFANALLEAIGRARSDVASRNAI